MTNVDKEQKTVDYYDRKAEDWVSKHGGNEGESYWKEEMERFHELIPTGKVLEIGSGAGKDAAALIVLGYDYIGTDASSGLLKIAEKRNPKAGFIHKRVEDLDFPKGSFDGFWTAATLLHIPKDKIDSVLKTIKKQIKPGGVGFISVKQGEDEGVDKSTGRWFAYYEQGEFTKILNRNDYKVVEQRVRPTEGDTIWLVFYVQT